MGLQVAPKTEAPAAADAHAADAADAAAERGAAAPAAGEEAGLGVGVLQRIL